MTYNPQIPQPNDRPSQSQGQLLTNFQQLDIVFKNNHVPLDDGTAANRGKHKFVSLLQQPGDPTTSSTDAALYSKVAGGTTQLFWRYQNSGTVVQLSSVNSPLRSGNGYTWLPGRLLLQWGTKTATSSSTTTVNFPIAFSSTPYSINLTWSRATITGSGDSIVFIYTGNFDPSATQFQVYSTKQGSNLDIYWMAIGPTT